MSGIAISFITAILLCAASIWADWRLQGHARLPMQFGLGGQINWSVPRRIGLMFTPALFVLIIGFVLVAGGAGAETQSALRWISVAFPIAHALHLFLAMRVL